jgi:predicted MFS family arabinose efflux permease
MEKEKIKLSSFKVVFMAMAVGIIVANMFYIQPMEELIALSFSVNSSVISVLAMLTQVSYALGLLLIVPLGDRFNRLHFLQSMEFLTVLSLGLAAVAPNPYVFGLAVLLIGLTAIGGQIIIPYAAYLTPMDHMGAIMGSMISGMLTGILFARAFSGVVAAYFGWHAVYGLAALLNLALLIGITLLVPNDPRVVEHPKSWFSIIGSIPGLVKKYRFVRSSALNAFCMFGIANLFWSSLVFVLARYYGWGSAAAGSLGLFGAVSIFAAPVIGRMVNRYSPRLNIEISWLLGVVSYIVFALFLQNIWALMGGIILLDLSTQFSQVTNQAIVQSQSRMESSRNTSILMFSYFLGGSIGTLTGINLWHAYGWAGVTVGAIVFLGIALVNFCVQGVPVKLGMKK